MHKPNTPNPLPGVPLVESPFFDEYLGGGVLSDEEYRIATDLRERGYAILDFPEPELAAMAERIKAATFAEEDFAAWRERKSYDLRSQDGWKTDPDVLRLATNRTIVALLSKLYGRQAFAFQTLTFPVGTQQHYHSDSIHFSSMPERFMCGVWVALEDIGPDQGPLLYYPGSHRWPIYTNEHIGFSHFGSKYTTQEVYEPLWERLVEVHGAEPVRFTARAGQALIWAANLLHGGDAHTDMGRTRWSQVTHYLFEDCAYYTPMGTDLPFGSVQFRRPYDISTGERVDSAYHGRPVPEAFIEASAPRHAAARFGEVRLPAGWDPAAYLDANPDLRAANADPEQHYIRYGAREGRRLRP